MITVTRESGEYVIRLAPDEEPVFVGREITILYSYDSDGRYGIQGTLHRYGRASEIESYRAKMQKMYSENDAFKNSTLHMITTDKVSPYQIQRMIDTAGWVGFWHQAYVLQDMDAQERINRLETEDLISQSRS